MGAAAFDARPKADHVTSKPCFFEADQVSFLDRFLDHDDCWVHHFEPETKTIDAVEAPWLTLSKEGNGRLISRKGDDISFLGCKGHCVHRLTLQRQNC